ncbi:quinoprotein relay system zinc metallohydrolase 2 [Zavarzinia sp.]|uniref:quinoprotein relay system zinc metallohydrolase 2 n=1 Tax=Zavarzinia sp. TaxID=2027920 RepID=UPI0035679E0D
MRARLALCLALVAAPLRAGADEAPPPVTPLPVTPLSVTPLPVTEVAPGVFVYAAPYELADPENEDAICNLGFVVGGQAVAVIDSGGSYLAGRRLLAAVRVVTGLPVRYLIDTHVHPDHVLGNAAFAEVGATIVGHAALPEALAARAGSYLAATERLIGAAAFAGTKAVPPDMVVTAQITLDLGGRELLLEAWPTAHTNSDLTAFDRTTGTWFLGDLVFSGHVPALDGSLTGWLAVLDRLTVRPAARVVPGHGPATLPWPEGAAATRRYLAVLAADIRRLIRTGATMSEAAASAGQSEKGAWSLFDDFAGRNATAAFHELEWE